MTRKGPQGVQAASVQLGSLTAWMHNSCSLAAGLLSSVALQLGSLTAWLHNSLLLGCLAGW